MSWFLIALIVIALVIVFYIVPFVLIIRWYNYKVRRHFITLCRELNLSAEELTFYRQGAFLYPTIRGSLSNYQLTLISEPGGQFRFSSGKARATGRHVVTQLTLKFADDSSEMTISLKRRPKTGATAFTDYFNLQGIHSSKLSAEVKSALITYAIGRNRNGFPIRINHGTIALELSGMIWTRRKRETALHAIKLVGQIASNVDEV